MKKITLLLSASLLILASCSKNDDNVNSDETLVIADTKPYAPLASTGFYVVNEDWFGTDNGSVNFFSNDAEIKYRAYRAANPEQMLGVTTEFATIYGDNVYFVSKQGNTLVVADAQTLKSKAVLTDVGGDGRSFLGINPSKGYIGTLKGVTKFDISKLATDGTIDGISGQVGNMCLIANRAFILVQGKGVYVVNTTTDKVEKLIDGSYNCMTQSKDGNIWIGSGIDLIKLNPYTLATTNIDVKDAPIAGSWGAWNAGSLCASTQKNVLYWINKGSVVKYDIDKKELNPAIYTLGTEDGAKVVFYGAGIRVNPLTDELVLIVKRSGWAANGSYNWVQILNNNGGLIKKIRLFGDNGTAAITGAENNGYYWFPAMPFYQDVNKPEVLLNQVILKPNQKVAICLSDKVYDADNMSTAIIKDIEFPESENITYSVSQDTLYIQAGKQVGKTQFTFKADSNGKTTQKAVRVDVRETI